MLGLALLMLNKDLFIKIHTRTVVKLVLILYEFLLCTVEKFKFSEFLLDDKNETYLSS